ncbi:MAG: M20/M25/M40 family metallo-hydrolase [Bacteroidales bacterium]|nr:M20/M25/M40 family metallo-hydrolase [Bacteroidales bacterium]
MKKQIRFILLAGVLLGFALPQYAQESARDKGYQSITKEVLQGQLEFLASDWTEGRETGTKGEYMAGDYIASLFKMYGLTPGGDLEPMRLDRRPRTSGGGAPQRLEPKRTYFQNINFIESSPGATQEMSIITKNGAGSRSVDFEYQTDFSVNAGQVGTEMEVPIVFVGYGLVDEKNGYDDFKGVDVKGKFVIKLNGFPGSKDVNSKAYAKFKPKMDPNDQSGRRQFGPGGPGGWSRYAWANQRGIVGVVEYRPGFDPTSQWAKNVPFRYNSATYEGDVPQPRNQKSYSIMGDSLKNDAMSITITERVMNEIINGLGIDFAAIEKQIAETGKPASRELTGKLIRIKTTVESRIVRGRNVVGVIEGKNKDEIIVIGGHYDHQGKQNGFIFNGADDNGSGTVGVMTVAKAIKESGIVPEKTLVFCAWTGEEKNLLGSKYFANHPYKEKMLCYLNYDMISRNSTGEDQDNKIEMTFSKKFTVSKELIEKFNKEMNMGLEIDFQGDSEQPGGGSDHAPFAQKGVPIYYFMAGMPPEYHKFGDHVELVNWDKMLKIVQLGYLSIFELAQMSWN